MSDFRSFIFTEAALENIQRTGNVWGHSTEYDFNFEIKIWRRKIKFEQRSAKQAWGRFGGGWSVKLGFQASSWKSLFLLRSVIINLFTMYIRISEI